MGIRSQNNPIAAYLDVFSRSGTDASTAAPGGGLTASGGIINDYTVSSDVYRTHIFTSSGTFEVTSLATDSSIPNNLEYLVVAGGGGGGGESAQSGGGGAGGFRTNLTGHPVKANRFGRRGSSIYSNSWCRWSWWCRTSTIWW